MSVKAKKWVVVCLLLVLVGTTGYVFYLRNVVNPRVIAELQTDPHGMRARKVMLLSFPDGKILPVNYLREDPHVYAGADFSWWKAFAGDGARVTLLVHGETLHGTARVVLDQPDFKETIFARLRPTVPKWLPDWLNGKLVIITLDSAASALE
ncbi:MAG: hypothetical protein O3C28_12575 [Proteobacteria bacterium]|nr:hypothetical protein [Pseudomonadota bacterium]